MILTRVFWAGAVYRLLDKTQLMTGANRWFVPLFCELTVTNLTHFGMLAVLAVTLSDNLHFSAQHTAALLAITSAGLRGSRVVFAPFIDRIAPNRLIPGAILCSLAGYAGMLQAERFTPVAFSLLAIGIGYGVNSMLVTTFASYTANKPNATFPIYALMNTGVNLAAALAPVIFNALRLDVSPHAPFAFSIAILSLSLAISLRIRADIPHIYRETRFIQAAGALLKSPQYAVVLFFIALGWALNTQKFAATPLFIANILHRPHYVGLAVMLEALIGLLVSIPLGHYIRSREIKSRDVLAMCFILYAIGYCLPALFPNLAGLWSGLLFWSLAESLLMPQLNTLIAQHTRAEHRLAGFSLAAAAIGVGEAFGNASGVALISLSIGWGHSGMGYGILAGVSVLAWLCTRRMRKDVN